MHEFHCFQLPSRAVFRSPWASNLGHGRDVDRVNSPYFPSQTGSQPCIRGALGRGDSTAKGGVTGRQSNGGVDIHLGRNSASAIRVALSSGAIAEICQ